MIRTFGRLLRAALWGAVVLLLPLVVSLGYTLSAYPSHFDGQADCGVVFGAAVWRKDTPSHALEDRIMAAADLYNDGHIECIVLSGGPSRFGAHEVDVMANQLIQEGVDPSILVYDYEGINTQATIENLSENLPNAHDLTWVMVSQDFHLARIGLIAHRFGLKQVSLHAAPYSRGRLAREPYYLFREVGGNIAYFFGYFPVSLSPQ